MYPIAAGRFARRRFLCAIESRKVGLESFGQLWHIINSNKHIDLLEYVLIKPN
jgi:hypothetical protein